MVEKMMSGFFQGIFKKIISLFMDNKELIKKIVWDLLISIVKNNKEKKEKENENKSEETTTSK